MDSLEALRKEIKKKEVRAWVRNKLARDNRWAKQALIRIYQRQTDEEKLKQRTLNSNNVGFTGFDALYLSSLAKQELQRGWLTTKQMQSLRSKIQKYHRQVISMSDEHQLLLLIKKSRDAQQMSLKLPL